MDKCPKAVAAIAVVLAFAADDHASGRSLRGHGTPIGSACSKNCGRTQTATAQQPGADGTPEAQEARPAQRCSVTGLVPQPPARRPHYALDVRVHPDLKTVEGALTLTFSAPEAARAPARRMTARMRLRSSASPNGLVT